MEPVSTAIGILGKVLIGIGIGTVAKGILESDEQPKKSSEYQSDYEWKKEQEDSLVGRGWNG